MNSCLIMTTAAKDDDVPKRWIIVGAGIAGLTVAHELVKSGAKASIHVYEKLPTSGGFFRSDVSSDTRIPSEYSWHGIGPWYHNTRRLLGEIPFPSPGHTTSVHDKLSPPIHFGVLGNTSPSSVNVTKYFDKSSAFRMTLWDKVIWARSLIKAWSSDKRSQREYSEINGYDFIKDGMSDQGAHTWRSTFGPWIGSDWTRVSHHHVGNFFEHNLWPDVPQRESSGNDEVGWSLLQGPSSDYWFTPWVRYLEDQGVQFHWSSELTGIALNSDNTEIQYLEFNHGAERVSGNMYTCALDPYSMTNVLRKNAMLLEDPNLALFPKLSEQLPHVQVSFRIAFKDHIQWPYENTAIVLADSEYNITLCDMQQIWDPVNEVRGGETMGPNIGSLWTCTACVSSVPGRIYGLPIESITKEQFITEVKAQIMSSELLDSIIFLYNGKYFHEYTIQAIEVWHEWVFQSPDGVRGKGTIGSVNPKWVNQTHNQKYRPSSRTSYTNLVLAGAHVQTKTDIWSIEGAVESGITASNMVLAMDDCSCRGTKLIVSEKWWLWKLLAFLDNILYALCLPQITDLFLFVCIAILLYFVTMVGLGTKVGLGRV